MSRQLPRTTAPGGKVLVLAALLLAALLAATLIPALGRTNGYLTYALDDAYIHMAMAKHVAQHGVWGVSAQEFSSSSSSPLWTALLGGLFWLIGPRPILPLVLNGLCALLLLWSAERLLRREFGMGPQARLASLLALVIFVPLVPVMLTGQEHVLHLLLIVLFLNGWVRLATARPPTSRTLPPILWLITPALAAVRYESLLLIGCAALILLLRRRVAAALLLLGLGAVVPILYGLVSVRQGWFFLPNPVLLKGNLPLGDPDALLKTLTGYVALRRLFIHAHLLVPLLTALGLLVAVVGRARSWPPLLSLFLATAVLHLTVADVGWFYRYEAYVVGLGVLAIGAGLSETMDRAGSSWLATLWRGRARPALVLALGLMVAPLADRSARATLETPRAMRNIYEQQIQMGRFLQSSFPGATVAMNDIGAASFLADIRCVDLMGLANRKVAASIRANRYGSRALQEILQAEGVTLAILYENWIRVPPEWTRVARWRIEDNVVTGGDTVAFYALRPEAARPLAEALARFAPRLPRTVQQAGP